MTLRAPALFIGHGSPMNAIEDTPSARGWAEIAARFPKPRAIVCVSAHWVTEGVRVTANAQPRTIHDFGRSFPQALFDVQYPAPGDPTLAEEIVSKLTPFGAKLDDSWGFDHGAWSVLRRLYPDADIPIVQVSLDAHRSPQEHYAIGEALADLRDDNVMILATGNIVHNLPAFFHASASKPDPLMSRFHDAVCGAVYAADFRAVTQYEGFPGAALAAPDWEHFVPVLYALGAAGRDAEQADLFNQDLTNGISMTSIAFGLPQ